MATSSIMPRQGRRSIPAPQVPCLVHWLCFMCLVACGSLSQLGFAHGIRGSQRVGMKQVAQRFSRKREDFPKELPGENPVLEARILTSRIKQTRSPEELIDILDEAAVDSPFFNCIHASAAYTRLAALKKRLSPTDWDNPVIFKLHARVQDMVLQDRLDEQGTANILWSIAKLSDRFRIPTELLDDLVKSWPAKAEGMIPQHLSNSLWASAQLKEAAPDVLLVVPTIVTQITKKAKGMNPQHLSNSIWACGQLQGVAPEVLQAVPAIIAQIPGKAKDMIPQQLSNSLWACGQLKGHAPKVLEIVPALLAEVSLKIKDMKAQEMQDSLQALVPLQELVPEVARPSVDIVRSAATRITTLLPRLRGKDFSIAVPVAVWACASLGVYHEELLLSVAQHLGSRKKLSRLPAYSLCALAWSYQILDAEDDFTQNEFAGLLQSVASSRGFSEADVESTKLGHLKWNCAVLGTHGPVQS
eukprot:Skav223932  [mRNA]  locus=scaffold2593:499835:501250:+ [translate_table: standard]